MTNSITSGGSTAPDVVIDIGASERTSVEKDKSTTTKIEGRGSYIGMLSRYAFEFEDKGDSTGGFYSVNPSSLGYNVLLQPVYTNPTGFIRLDTDVLDLNVSQDRAWSASTNNGDAFSVSIYQTNVRSSVISWRWLTYSLRDNTRRVKMVKDKPACRFS